MAYLLIVDDDEDFANAEAHILRKIGHEVEIELDTQSAAVRMETRRPDLMILDLMFPEDPSGGFAFARAIRKGDAGLKDLPILMLSAVNKQFPLGFSSQDINNEWMPVSDFLEKPVDFDLLKTKVSQILSRTTPSKWTEPQA